MPQLINDKEKQQKKPRASMWVKIHQDFFFILKKIQFVTGMSLIRLTQRSVRPVPKSITFNIVSRCFENKKNDCCEKNDCKNAICLLFTLQIHNLAILLPGHLTRRVARNGFVINKQMDFLQSFVSQQLLFFIFKTSGYNVDLTDCVFVETYL